MSDETDERIRKGLSQTFSPDWAADVGKKLAEKIRTSETATKAANWTGQKLVDYARWTQKDHSGVVPGPVRRPMETVQKAYMDNAYAEKNRRDEQELELQAIRERVQALQEVKDRQAAPRDEGELDAPQGRQPVQMSREFPTNEQGEADKAEYIRQKTEEAIRRAKQ